MSTTSNTSSAAAADQGASATGTNEIAKHWIGGDWTGSDTVSESINPATGEVLGRWADGGEAEARAAIAAARRALPSAGTSHGPHAFIDNFGEMFSRWENQAFNVTTMFAADENVAVFGDFRYRSNSLGKVVSSPFSILVKVVDGKVTYVQFQEDTYATAASFRKDGTWTVQTEEGAEPFEV